MRSVQLGYQLTCARSQVTESGEQEELNRLEAPAYNDQYSPRYSHIPRSTATAPRSITCANRGCPLLKSVRIIYRSNSAVHPSFVVLLIVACGYSTRHFFQYPPRTHSSEDTYRRVGGAATGFAGELGDPFPAFDARIGILLEVTMSDYKTNAGSRAYAHLHANRPCDPPARLSCYTRTDISARCHAACDAWGIVRHVTRTHRLES